MQSLYPKARLNVSIIREMRPGSKIDKGGGLGAVLAQTRDLCLAAQEHISPCYMSRSIDFIQIASPQHYRFQNVTYLLQASAHFLALVA